MTDNLSADGRQVITPGERILGGVFFGRAAIVVDYEENPEAYDDGYKDFKSLLDPNEEPIITISRSLRRVMDTNLPMSPDRMFEVLKKSAKARGLERLDRSTAIGLSEFVVLQAAYCQQIALYGGALLELFERENHTGGKVSIIQPSTYDWYNDRHIDVSYVRGDAEAVIDHVSVRYWDTNSGGLRMDLLARH